MCCRVYGACIGVDGAMVEFQLGQLQLLSFLLLLHWRSAVPTASSSTTCDGLTPYSIQDCRFAQQVPAKRFLLGPYGDLGATPIDDVGGGVRKLWRQS